MVAVTISAVRRVLGFHWLRFWIGLVAGLQALGWGLSLVGALGPAGYALGLPPVVFLAFLAAGWQTRPELAAGVANSTGEIPAASSWWRRPRFRSVLPRLFLVLAVGSLVTGLCYLPNNGDALAYRTPRVLNWLMEGQWHWVDTIDARFNTRTVAYEWVTAPFLALTGSDRLLPLISVASFLLLPGVLYGMWRHLGVSGRVAWEWMWLLPTGYGFALQAGGVLSDLFGTLFAVAAVYLARLASVRQDASAGRFSLLAAALMVGTKASNLPLLLPWALALRPAIPLLLRRRGALTLAAALALVGSNVPIAIINTVQCGDWKGLAAETRARDMIGHGHPVAYLIHNIGLVLGQNLNPPILPGASSLNRWMEAQWPAVWREWTQKAVEDGTRAYRFRELPHEDFAGMGLPLTVVALGCLLFHGRGRRPDAPAASWEELAIVWSPWISALVYGSQSGIVTAARLMMPYYPLMLIGLLRGDGVARWVHTAWWRWGTVAAAASSIFVCVVSPMRPWFPVMTLLDQWPAKPTEGSMGTRLRLVYRVHQERATGFDPFLAHLPATVTRIGMVAQFQFMEGPLWRPYGLRRVIRPAKTPLPSAFLEKGVRHVFLRVEDVPRLTPLDADAWVKAGQGQVIHRGVMRHFPVEGPTEWWLVRLGEEP